MMLLTAVQLSVSSYLLLHRPPDLLFSEDSQTVVCAASFSQRLHSHLYNVLLLALTVLLYFAFSQVRLNFLEAKYVGVSSLLSGPIMVSWVVAGITVRTDNQDLVTILGLLVTSVVTGLCMLVLVRLHNKEEGYRSGYKQARKLPYFSIFPAKLGNKVSCVQIHCAMPRPLNVRFCKQNHSSLGRAVVFFY